MTDARRSARDRARWGLIGVPSSAAAHWPGVDQAPRALRASGLVEQLRTRSIEVEDLGDLPTSTWRADRRDGGVNNVAAVVAGLAEARQRIVRALRSGYRPLVVGGECTLTLAMVSAFLDDDRDVGVVYVDGGQDLVVPAEHPEEPIADAMGVAHLLDLPGVDDSLASVGPRRPLLDSSRIVFFGYADREEDVHGRVHSTRIPASAINAEPEASAMQALSALASPEIVIHLDVDVLDFLETPAADIAIYDRGLRRESLARALRVLAGDPRCRGLLLVEYNPDHDPSRTAAATLVDLLAGGLPDGTDDPIDDTTMHGGRDDDG
ncbi:arginase family protein [Agromyces salentinus]|uniref:Arginase n=1 Tax=Agromyces salentinus TaxID=269421 RepID=A0ABP4YT80_9MICO|nr:arginase family protein [Agromyces salentinus]